MTFALSSVVFVMLGLTLLLILVNLFVRVLVILKVAGFAGIDPKKLPDWIRTDLVMFCGLVLVGLVSGVKVDWEALGGFLAGVPPQTLETIRNLLTGTAFGAAWVTVTGPLAVQIGLKLAQLFTTQPTPTPAQVVQTSPPQGP
ncbi:MAG TPA: hypothetical protein VGL40_15855 [Bacillota bacterium]